MDDSCAVCADTLEWVAYGACGHREVCSTCVVRLRFICQDRRCCICKTESDVVFVTKALGDYTRMISDFSVLPSEVREGRVGSYWYHEDTQAFFDDVDHYKMIKAMCKLSCSECDRTEEQSNDGPKRRGKIRNVEQLKGHLFHKHRLFMCSLCLEGRKVFICEQKLYTRAQLNQHINSGDSEVDGTESERGGFMGHPVCEFCRTPFYGDNELYSHMSTEHYTCHICQRQHPGQYEYYKNYDDLEMHFRHGHFLCEDESCLAKKFVVFQSEAEMKRHNTIEHGGRLSRSKRNAALQIPTSFRYQRTSEQDHRRGRGGRGRTFRRDSSENQLSMAIQASLETAHAENTFHDPSSSSGQVAPHLGDISDIDPIVDPFESLTTTDIETSSRYRQALGHSSSNAPLEESSFPPLSVAPSSSQSNPRSDSDGLPNNTMAAHLRRKSNRKVAVNSSGQAWPAARRGPVVQPTSSAQAWPTTNVSPIISGGSGQNNGPRPSSYASSAQAQVETRQTTVLRGSGQNNGSRPSSYASSAQAQVETRQTTVHGLSSSGSLWDSSKTKSGRISHSTSAPNLVENGSVQPSVSDFPPVSAAQVRKFPTTSQAVLKVGDVQTANKSLVEKIRAALEFDEDKYTTFKDISGQYRQGLVATEIYLDFVRQFGLLHLVLDLARLCPDGQKQKELIDAYNASIRNNIAQGDGWSQGNVRLKEGNSSKKGKGKISEAENSISKNTLADSFLSSVQELQSNYRPSEEAVEVLPKDGYRAAKEKSKLLVNEHQEELNSRSQPLVQLRGEKDSQTTGGGPNPNLGNGGGGSKQRKKSSKFHRVRLGDGSAAALLDLRNSDPQPDAGNERLDGSSNSAGGLPVQGVWRKGTQKLFS
ncbi:E3 ubiquitin-protein ligase ZNF598 [Prunus avium]|uniref:RING-type E3 ubiquitin transferase n=1 Tax=Prunus avium TaxID=42229 RepID=A0A6P5U089_PRUAV|nr:E3 ubiquitin-protein ligase ZNF598 [Prunus avium]